MIEEMPAAEYSLGALGIRGFAVNENDEIDLTQNVGRAKLGIDVANSRTYRDRRPQVLGCPERPDQRPPAGVMRPTGGRWTDYRNDCQPTLVGGRKKQPRGGLAVLEELTSA